MTLHSAKGLEFDSVFLAGLEDGLFPHSHSLNSPQDLEEERRLCYVGITRARRKLFITWTPFRKNYGMDAGIPAEMSRFLNEMPAELIEKIESDALNEYDQRTRSSRRFSEDEEPYRAPEVHATIKSPSGRIPKVQPKSIAELRAYLKEQNKSSSGSTEATPKGPVIKAGTRVRHDQFGDGIVLSRERSGNNIKLVVTFSRVGRKSLIEQYAKLKVL